MQKGNNNGTLKILTNNMSGGILPLTDETLQLLELNHLDAKTLPNRRYYNDQYKKCIQLCMMTLTKS